MLSAGPPLILIEMSMPNRDWTIIVQTLDRPVNSLKKIYFDLRKSKMDS